MVLERWRKTEIRPKDQLRHFKRKSITKGAIYPVFAYSADHARELMRPASERHLTLKHSLPPGLETRLLCPLAFQKCHPGAVEPGQDLLFGGDLLVCREWYRIPTDSKEGFDWKCAKFAPSCRAPGCLDRKAKKPGLYALPSVSSASLSSGS